MTERNEGANKNPEPQKRPWVIPQGGIIVGPEVWSRPETRMRTPVIPVEVFMQHAAKSGKNAERIDEVD
jgi:hypothetical protein